ncbi:CBN-SRJ-22 protein [Caenorhabditis brenneri]|uniref:CBN-SRJ-22 protein n=1 Tax=Caenorhabditis brenneri TaxID=135651 RepID=G0NEI4_CAEBE|nr:CBN-SRJ-22 protein [Caenorhabditis brenneri]
MYINLAQFLIPKITSVCSFIINPLTVYIVWNDKKLQLGSYRYLLFYFAIFNMSASLADMLVPMCVLNYRYAFSVFISDGWFEQFSNFNHFMISFRCGFISGTYAVLHAHFLYRFCVLFNNQFLTRYFLPHGLITAVLYCLAHITYWTFFLYYYCGGDLSRRLYIRESMFEHHGKDVMNMTIIIVQYFEGTPEAIYDSILGISCLSVLSFISLVLIFYFGHKIWFRLNSQNSDMSEKTKKLQAQLIKALIVQAAIPTCVSFAPCIIAWYQPIFALDFGRWLQFAAGIAVSTFPALDPLALIYFVPTLRKRFLEIVMLKKFTKKSKTTSSSHLSYVASSGAT